MSWEIHIHPAGAPRGQWQPVGFGTFVLRADALHWLHLLRRQRPHDAFRLEQVRPAMFTEAGKPVLYPEGQVPR